MAKEIAIVTIHFVQIGIFGEQATNSYMRPAGMMRIRRWNQTRDNPFFDHKVVSRQQELVEKAPDSFRRNYFVA